MRARWAVFLSGRGSTAQALMDLRGQLDVACVVSSKKSAPGVGRAGRSGLPVIFFAGDWEQLHADLEKRRVNLIFLLGFMKVLPSSFLEKWKGRTINLHPSLLPAFPGLQALEKSFADSNARMGATVHEVVAAVDAGPILRQHPIGRKLNLAEQQVVLSIAEQHLVRSMAAGWRGSNCWNQH